jgi:hypothetical protein
MRRWHGPGANVAAAKDLRSGERATCCVSFTDLCRSQVRKNEQYQSDDHDPRQCYQCHTGSSTRRISHHRLPRGRCQLVEGRASSRPAVETGGMLQRAGSSGTADRIHGVAMHKYINPPIPYTIYSDTKVLQDAGPPVTS